MKRSPEVIETLKKVEDLIEKGQFKTASYELSTGFTWSEQPEGNLFWFNIQEGLLRHAKTLV